jgi:hypothetical protein
MTLRTNIELEPSIRRSSVRGLPLLAFFAAVAVYGVTSQVRLVDADEGYLLTAAELVQRGAAPYRDFFFPQGPLLPYAYAYLLTPTGLGWRAARLLSAIFVAIACACVIAAVQRRGAGRFAVGAALLLTLTSGLLLCWGPLAKTYALTAACLGLAYLATIRDRREAKDRPAVRGLAFGGFFVLAVATRAYLVVIAPVLLALLLRSVPRATKERLRTAAAAAGGALVAAIPLMVVVARSRADALFGLLHYHAVRSGLAPTAAMLQKLETVEALIGAGSSDFLLGAQVGVPAIGAAVVAALRPAARERLAPSLVVAVSVLLVSLIPTPTYFQYFVLVAPFVLEAAAIAFEELTASTAVLRAWAAAAVAVLFIAVALREVRRHVNGRDVIGIDDRDAWRIASIEEVGHALRARASCGGILSTWPGYLVGTAVTPWPRVESHFATHAGGMIATRDERIARHVASADDLIEVIEQQQAAVVVVGNWHRYMFGTRDAELDERLRASGYHRSETRHGAAIWLRSNCVAAVGGQ